MDKIDTNYNNNYFSFVSAGTAHLRAKTPSKDYSVEAERKSKEIIRYVVADDFVEGEISKTQLYLESLYAKNKVVFRDSFHKAWVRLFELDNSHHLYVLASVASCLPYEWLEEHGITLILGCSAHSDYSVNEACIRAAEAWEQPSHASYLEKMREFEFAWLEEYKTDTIEYLKGLE